VIDTHAHVHARAFDKDRAAVLDRVWASGARYLVEVNITAEGWPRVLEMAESDPRIFVTVGIHPHDTEGASIADLEQLLAKADHPKVCAIGETGLDYFRDYAPHEIQRGFFRRQVAAARETGLPLVVHSRAAHDDVLRILREEGRGEVRGVMHCFSGDEEVASRATDLGFLLGFGGAVTYSPRKSAPLLRAIGLERMVLETDCPYLTPHPRRKDRNEPANIPTIAAAVAEYLEVGVADVERVTDANAIRLFRLPG
jgi:TatD DNase family protein